MPAQSSSDLAIAGDRTTGADAREANVNAASAVANIVKSSLGPVGLDQLIVDDVGDVTITNDGATILKLLDVEHPAGKVLVELAELQDAEVGDGTTSVVILAAELLKRANVLVQNKIHPTSVISGYRLAMREALKFIEERMTMPVDVVSRESLIAVAKTSMSSKIIGLGSEFFANLAVDAITSVKVTNDLGESRYPIKAINILKAHGKSTTESQLIKGFSLNCRRATDAMPSFVKNAKIALLDFKLAKHRLHMGIQVLVDDPTKLEDIRKREYDIVREKIELILKAGANVILTTQTIDDMALKPFVEAGAMAVRRCKKEDLKRIARITGGTLVTSLAGLDGEESFDPSLLGSAEEVAEERVADDYLINIRGCANTRACSVLLRGANEYALDECERSLHDTLCVLKRTLESSKLTVGGGCVDAALSIMLENFATTLGSKAQMAIAEFSSALLIIPKTLAVNAACDATDLVARLRAYHHTSQTDSQQEKLKWTGLDLTTGKVRNNLDSGVLEPAKLKIKQIQFATEACITLLRLDDCIRLHPEPQQQDPHAH